VLFKFEATLFCNPPLSWEYWIVSWMLACTGVSWWGGYE